VAGTRRIAEDHQEVVDPGLGREPPDRLGALLRGAEDEPVLEELRQGDLVGRGHPRQVGDRPVLEQRPRHRQRRGPELLLGALPVVGGPAEADGGDVRGPAGVSGRGPVVVGHAAHGGQGHQRVGDPPVPEPARAAQPAGGPCGHVQRDAAGLQRLGDDRDVVEGVHAVAEAEPVLRPGQLEDPGRLVHALGPFLPRDADSAVVHRQVAGPDAQPGPAPGELVEGGDVLGQFDGVVERGDGDGGADADPLGARGDGEGQRDR
jgi:hypothetical protein